MKIYLPKQDQSPQQNASRGRATQYRQKTGNEEELSISQFQISKI